MNKTKQNKKLKIIDLFAGCGGLSYGFEMAGYDVLLGTDNWMDSLETFKHNHKNSKILCEDISKVTKKDILDLIDNKEVDVLVGGPPCQGFSLAGKRDSKDDRNKLVMEYVRVVKELNPKFFVLENVLGILSMKDEKNNLVIDNLKKAFAKIGYQISYKPLFAHHYGVPQKRQRVVIVGNRLGINFEFPKPTHDGIQNKFTTVGDAISDLPLLEKDFGEETVKHKITPKSDYQKMMRKNTDLLKNHTKSAHSEQTTRVISFVPEGGNWKDLPKEYQNIRSYSNTWRRLDSKLPSVTIDTGHRHHFHYKANRVPTVRESARIQSFPDTFEFKGTRTSQFKQVGNAVPPLLAKAIAEKIKSYLI
ncbi:MAG: DNA cytosine methyltransferase [bacterium]|jgi:DNA (cytosine-5)-methyltransferase 1